MWNIFPLNKNERHRTVRDDFLSLFVILKTTNKSRCTIKLSSPHSTSADSRSFRSNNGKPTAPNEATNTKRSDVAGHGQKRKRIKKSRGGDKS